MSHKNGGPKIPTASLVAIDLLIRSHGPKVAIIRPLTEKGREWLKAHDAPAESFEAGYTLAMDREHVGKLVSLALVDGVSCAVELDMIEGDEGGDEGVGE